MSQPRVLGVVINWNGAAHLPDCLASLLAQDYPADRFELLVIDNASRDGSGRAADALSPRIDLVHNARNLDFVRAANQGVRAALERGVEFVWVLNNDITAPPHALRELVDAAGSDPCTGILSPVIESSRRAESPPHVGYALDFRTGRLRWLEPTATEAPAVPVTAVIGCALLVRTDVFRGVGLLPEIYRAYFEEIEFQVRAARAGYRVVVVPAASVMHHEAASYDRAILRRAGLLLRNLWLFEWRNAPRRDWLLFVPYYILVHVPWFVMRGIVYGLRRLGRRNACVLPGRGISPRV